MEANIRTRQRIIDQRKPGDCSQNQKTNIEKGIWPGQNPIGRMFRKIEPESKASFWNIGYIH